MDDSSFATRWFHVILKAVSKAIVKCWLPHVTQLALPWTRISHSPRSQPPHAAELLCDIVYSYAQEDTLSHLLVLRALKEKLGSEVPVYVACLSHFVSLDANLSLDLGEAGAQSEGFIVQCRAQGNLNYWKIVLTNKEFSGQQAAYTYEAKFLVELNSENVETIMIPFNNFQAYYRGSIVEDAPPLDLEKIGTFGLQTFGGVYDEFKQSGVGSLEIDLIALF